MSEQPDKRRIYLGMFLIALTSLALEITFTRFLSVTTWYHLAFFTIGTAMLGMTAGATIVYLKPHWFAGKRLYQTITESSYAFALVTPFSLVVLSVTPLGNADFSIFVRILFTLISTTACAVPFFFSGIAVSGILTKSTLPYGHIYASDLLGAAMGCLLVLGGLELFDAPSLIILCAAIGALAGLCFAGRLVGTRQKRMGFLLVASLVAISIINTQVRWLRPYIVKGYKDNISDYQYEEWNSFSHVVVYQEETGPPWYWAQSFQAPEYTVTQHMMRIDGSAGTTVHQFRSDEDIEFLYYDATNVAHYLRPDGRACVIGVGGGRDIQSALLFGHDSVVGVELNPIFTRLLRNEFADFSGLADRPDVELVADEARSYFSRTDVECNVMQMSLVDTWAATGAGAFALSENSIYTIEAWQVFLNRLDDGGVFTVSRWYNPENPSGIGRFVSLAVGTLFESGIDTPADHITIVSNGYISTLIMSREPLTDDDISTLRAISDDLDYELTILPGQQTADPTLRAIMEAQSMADLLDIVGAMPYNYAPPRDESPYFFHQLRFKNLAAISQDEPEEGVIKGNLEATRTLALLIICLSVLVIATVAVPLLIKKRNLSKLGEIPPAVIWPAAVYFSLIGIGFMLTEIGLIQRLSVFLSHPIYALGILLFTVILSAGIGSLLSERLPLTNRPWIFIYPVVTAAAILGSYFLLSYLVRQMVTATMLIKVITSILIIAPVGILLGFFFPTGMKLVEALGAEETPWYWALNGIFGTLCSALGVFLAIFSSISTNIYIAVVAYGLLPIFIYQIVRWQGRS
ncbi:MAG: hypothetical protein JXJ17_04395 [Anaerolineae bacterium]|nr:hypothetical protein [Anaerolineae bacterium]